MQFLFEPKQRGTPATIDECLADLQSRWDVYLDSCIARLLSR
jgi:hypothetical protein